MVDLSNIDLKILAFLESDLPLQSEPFRILSESIGISVEELLDRIYFLVENGYIRRFGAILKHQKYGYKANAMVVWKLDEEQLRKLKKIVREKKNISHAYERLTVPGKWEYNFFTMIHGKTKGELTNIIRELSESLETKEFYIYKSIKEFKKSSPVYARRILDEREKKF